MKNLFVLVTVSIFVAACASTSEEQPIGQYCYTDQEITVKNGEEVASESVIQCSDKPKVNHVTRSAGVAGECRSYIHKIRRNGVTKNVKGFLCRFPDGTWEPVNGVFAY